MTYEASDVMHADLEGSLQRVAVKLPTPLGADASPLIWEASVVRGRGRKVES